MAVSRGEREERARVRAAGLAEAAELAARTRVLEESLEDFGRRHGELRDRLGGLRFTAEIDPGLGTVTVDGTGRVLEIGFEPRAVAVADPSRLGPRVLEALNKARAEASAARREALNPKESR